MQLEELNDDILKSEFFNEIIGRIEHDIKGLKSANITNVLLDILRDYDIEDSEDFKLLKKKMTPNFRMKLKQIYQENGYFFHELNGVEPSGFDIFDF